ncbi:MULTISPECIES: hypothetical protein [Caballeronia]|uniref:hypothetical protein n=1 Tax=Caballeronia TaxID=1827195 RepID=UPI001FD56ADE|nr:MULTISPECIES: hypothetical protein [Caballeronia]MDR5799039.1 hypothetical protein [Caballeronia sp. LZ001]
MKKILLAASVALLLSATAHAECSITYYTGPSTWEALEKNGGVEFSNYKSVCEKLRRANARVNITGAATVLNNMSIGWAQVSVLDMNTSVGTTEYASYSTTANPFASIDKANELMLSSVNAAMNSWRELDNALAKLEAERNRARLTFARQ